MKSIIQKEAAQIRENSGDQLSDYEALRKGEYSCVTAMSMVPWLTVMLVYSIKEAIPYSLWHFTPIPFGVFAYMWMNRRMARLRTFCSFYESRIGSAPLKEEEIEQNNKKLA